MCTWSFPLDQLSSCLLSPPMALVIQSKNKKAKTKTPKMKKKEKQMKTEQLEALMSTETRWRGHQIKSGKKGKTTPTILCSQSRRRGFNDLISLQNNVPPWGKLPLISLTNNHGGKQKEWRRRKLHMGFGFDFGS